MADPAGEKQSMALFAPRLQFHLNSVIETCVAPRGLGSGAVRRGSQGHL